MRAGAGPAPWGRSAVRDGYAVAAVVWVALVATGLVVGQNDARAYWLHRLPDLYTSPAYDASFGFYYSPAFAQAIAPLTALPLPAFLAIWASLSLAIIGWLSGRWAVLALLFPPVALELWYGNVNILFALVAVAGLRYPGLWALPLLTKVTPGVGILWFAARREWRSLGIAVGTAAAIALVSAILAPDLWRQWIGLLLTNADVPVGLPVGPLWLRLPIAALLVTWGARTDRRWVIPVAMLLGSPRIWLASGAVLLAVPALAFRSVSYPDVDATVVPRHGDG